MDEEINQDELYSGEPKSPEAGDELKEMSVKELKGMLNESIKNENYERASIIRDEINQRKKD